MESNEREMHKAVCSECGEDCEVPFKPTEGKDVHCKECFAKRRPQRNNFNNRSGGGRFGGGNRPPREMHKAVCAECKKDCEVPFKPTEGKPVLCQECFRNKR